MVGIAFLFTSVRDFPPSIWGKISTVVQILTALVLAVRCAYPGLDEPWTDGFVWATGAITIWSGLDYVLRALRTLAQLRKS
jgi:phosphatidylglycerophosphate synthase